MMRAFATFRNSGAMIVLVVTYAVFSVAAPSFFGLQNLLDITHVISPMIIVATGMALVVMSGKLDISVGSIAYVASAVFALIMRNGTLSVPAAVVASMAAGVGLGCVNAAIVARPPLIAQRRHVHRVRVARIDHDPSNRVGVVESLKNPGRPAVQRFVNPSAP